MALINLLQIEQGAKLREIIQSYPADKVITSITKTEAKGEVKEVKYTVDEYLKVLDEQLSDVLKAAQSQEVELARDEVIELGEEAVESFELASTPNETLVKIDVNGVVYVEGVDFTVNRAPEEEDVASVVTWGMAKDMPLDTELADKIVVSYNINTIKAVETNSITFGDGSKLIIEQDDEE